MLKPIALAVALCAAGAAFWARPATAEGSALKTMVTADDSRGWNAVGRLDIGTRTFCTGALIAENLVLTAGHCLYDRTTGETAGAGEIQFLAGWRGGRAEAYRGARRLVVHPGYLADASDRSVDLALIELDRPIRTTAIRPFETARRRFLLRDVGVVSYAHDRAEAPSIQDTCHVLGKIDGTLVLDCEVDFGSSGAPVFDLSDGTPRIISVVSAKGEVGAQRVSLGTDLQGPLAEMRALLDTTERMFDLPQITTATGGGEGADGTGAKVVRP